MTGDAAAAGARARRRELLLLLAVRRAERQPRAEQPAQRAQGSGGGARVSAGSTVPG